MAQRSRLDTATDADLLRESRHSSAAFRADEVTDANGNPAYLGTKEVVAINGVVAGGCIGLDQAGMTRDCYMGQAAVDQEIISQDFLGQPVLGLGHG